jgi:hypothetical protein
MRRIEMCSLSIRSGMEVVISQGTLSASKLVMATVTLGRDNGT